MAQLFPGLNPQSNCSFTSALKHNIPYTMQRAPGGDSDSYYQEDYQPAVVNSSFVATVAWGQAYPFLLDMLGSHQKVGTKIRRVNPEKHPYDPQLYCVGCKLLRNLGTLTNSPANNNAVQYEYVEYLCTFGAFLYNVVEDWTIDANPAIGELARYIERRPNQIGQSIQTSLAAFEFATAVGGINQAIITPPAIQIPYREIEYVWRYVPDDLGALTALADSYYGTLNGSSKGGTVIKASWSSNVATVTTSTATGLAVGDTVVVSGIVPAGYNGTFVVTSVFANGITYALTPNPGAYTSGGTVAGTTGGNFDVGGDGPSDLGYPPGTLMYLGMKRVPIPSTPLGNRLYDVTHKFGFFSHGWNYAYRGLQGGPFADVQGVMGPWDLVRSRADHSTPPYASNNMGNLFHL